MSHSLQPVRGFASFVSTAILFAGLSLAAPAAASPDDQSSVPITDVAKKTATQAAAKEKPAPAIVNINTATSTELQTLPGIGAATATRILEYRQKNGGFKKVEDLMNIRGIGEKSFLKLKPLITITPPKVFSL